MPCCSPACACYVRVAVSEALGQTSGRVGPALARMHIGAHLALTLPSVCPFVDMRINRELKNVFQSIPHDIRFA